MMSCKNSQPTILKERQCKTQRTKIIFLALLFIFTCVAFASAEDLIPSELQTFTENLQDTAQGKAVRIVLGICMIGVGIGLAVSKQSAQAKAGAIAVGIGGACVMFGPQIIEKLLGSS